MTWKLLSLHFYLRPVGGATKLCESNQTVHPDGVSAVVGHRGASVSVFRLGTPGSPSGRPSRRRTTSSASASTSSTSEPADTH